VLIVAAVSEEVLASMLKSATRQLKWSSSWSPPPPPSKQRLFRSILRIRWWPLLKTPPPTIPLPKSNPLSKRQWTKLKTTTKTTRSFPPIVLDGADPEAQPDGHSHERTDDDRSSCKPVRFAAARPRPFFLPLELFPSIFLPFFAILLRQSAATGGDDAGAGERESLFGCRRRRGGGEGGRVGEGKKRDGRNLFERGRLVSGLGRGGRSGKGCVRRRNPSSEKKRRKGETGREKGEKQPAGEEKGDGDGGIAEGGGGRRGQGERAAGLTARRTSAESRRCEASQHRNERKRQTTTSITQAL
jgi:hypothetical protein